MTPRSRTTRLAAGALALGALAAASACSGGSTAAPTPPPGPSTSSSVTSTAPAPKPGAVNPFTGIGPVPTDPTIAVKIDDTAPGRPQVGIDKADVVYIEAVEGGLTRLVAIFGTQLPSAVGYVRSTRPSDPDLLLQYGKITEAYSGGAHDSLPRVHRSGITSWSQDDGRPYYTRVTRSQSDYINLTLNLAQVAKAVHSPPPRNIGWTFSRSTQGIGQTSPATDIHTAVTGSYSAGTPVEFRWDAGLNKYVRYIDGQRQVAADGTPIAATNVIVQYCTVKSHPEDTDINGNPSQFTVTTGGGKVVVFRNATRIGGTWQRTGVASGTSLRTASGKTLPLMPGNTWVVLVSRGTPTTS